MWLTSEKEQVHAEIVCVYLTSLSNKTGHDIYKHVNEEVENAI